MVVVHIFTAPIYGHRSVHLYIYKSIHTYIYIYIYFRSHFGPLCTEEPWPRSHRRGPRPSIRNRNREITTTNVRDPYKMIGFGGGGGKNLCKIIRIFTTTTAKPYYFIGIADIGGGNLSVLQRRRARLAS